MLQNIAFIHNFGELPIRRPNRAPPAATKDGPRTNDEIRNAQIQLIDQTGLNHGTVETVVAVKMALEAGMDLVEISPNNNPPVCKIMDYGKFKYEQAKKEKESAKKHKQSELKGIQMFPNIEEHDFVVKVKSAIKFLEEGDKVKVTVRFKGRQITHPEFGRQQMEKVVQMTSQVGQVEKPPSMEGRMMTMILSPLKSAQQPAKPAPAPRPASPPPSPPPGQAPPAA